MKASIDLAMWVAAAFAADAHGGEKTQRLFRRTLTLIAGADRDDGEMAAKKRKKRKKNWDSILLTFAL